ncbi:uncharacterized protein LACBIDRAFT_334567 [Laccaria bicolor S238N-H82]|uniref:Predicted protein n=1 Tax=Laccaria bicolor (strain S238N-H82 / ATCC MYA-4686) TaxID=486041 RepID=B0DZI5_LACBS|nr:uncharacterized protein LACBIDRAFT_334567 [Laccaria bicolor S238N-H82]EDQ99947.1 predicted protein [Laccaria bicolor S238N-H82]|eukprot:XP_001889358.1 predicted protein [Laccaria bicolor S238N-H82]
MDSIWIIPGKRRQYQLVANAATMVMSDSSTGPAHCQHNLTHRILMNTYNIYATLKNAKVLEWETQRAGQPWDEIFRRSGEITDWHLTLCCVRRIFVFASGTYSCANDLSNTGWDDRRRNNSQILNSYGPLHFRKMGLKNNGGILEQRNVHTHLRFVLTGSLMVTSWAGSGEKGCAASGTGKLHPKNQQSLRVKPSTLGLLLKHLRHCCVEEWIRMESIGEMFTLGDQSLLWTFFEHFCQIKPSKKLLPHCSCFFGTILHQAQCKPLNLSRPGNALLKGINFTYFTNRLEILRRIERALQKLGCCHR